MPEMTFTVRWPDGRTDECYSPSLVMHDHLTVGSSYTIEDFTVRSTTALDEASERVRKKFGFACSSAAITSEHIVAAAGRYAPNGVVEVVSMSPGREAL